MPAALLDKRTAQVGFIGLGLMGSRLTQRLDSFGWSRGQSFSRTDREQVAAILSKTKEAAMTGKFELFKTSSHYDGTIQNPSWLGYTSG